MANGNPLNNLEHNNIPPREYSASNYHAYLTSVYAQSYCQTPWNEYKFDDYAGDVYIIPPRPIYLSTEIPYNGIAPLKLMETINPPYPYDLDINGYR